jgi:23S rRNA pseudouridine1911/1915/1917 synthase
MSSCYNFPPSIYHFISSGNISLTDLIERELHLSHKEILYLLSLGSIFLNKERVFDSLELKADDYVRVHPYPRRFPIQEIDWGSRIIFENEDFIIFNKPAGIPVHATLDNAVENVLHQLQIFCHHPIFVTQRLDIPVGGLLVLAKTKKFQSDFNRLLIKRAVDKHYHAMTSNRPPLGRQTHFMEKSLSAPKILHASSGENRLQCDLEILSTEIRGEFFMNEIRLLTGRTHQIRAQLSFLNCPIVGDTPYGGVANPINHRFIFLLATSLRFRDFNFSLPLKSEPFGSSVFWCSP